MYLDLLMYIAYTLNSKPIYVYKLLSEYYRLKHLSLIAPYIITRTSGAMLASKMFVYIYKSDMPTFISFLF